MSDRRMSKGKPKQGKILESVTKLLLQFVIIRHRLERLQLPSSKLQVPKKQCRSKVEAWSLELPWILELGAWSLGCSLVMICGNRNNGFWRRLSLRRRIQPVFQQCGDFVLDLIELVELQSRIH